MLESLKDLVEKNATWFLAFFSLSVAANFLEIVSFFRDRRRSKEEALQREEDKRRLATYEFLFTRAEKQVMSEAELQAVQQEISKRSSSIPELDRRIELLRQAAKKEIVAQNIERNLSIIRDAHEELEKLRTDHAALGELPDLPEPARRQIEEEVRMHAKRPYEIPKSLTFRCLLLVLFIMLLPWPVDTFLTVGFMHVFLIAFFDASNLSPEAEMGQWIMRNRRRIAIGSTLGAWYLLIQALDNLLARPLQTGADIAVEVLLDEVSHSKHQFLRLLLDRGYIIGEIVTLGISVFAGIIHWRLIEKRVLNHVTNT